MKKLYSIGGLLLALVLFLAANLLFNTLFRSTRFDLTENRLYTLSEGSKKVLAKLNDPVKLRFYFSKKLSADTGAMVGYAQRVQELLEEFANHSNGKVTLEVYDPEPFSEEEDRAVGFGLQGAPLNAGGEKFYFGLAGSGLTDQEEVIAFFQQSKEESLEYDITKLVYNLSNPKKKVVGLLSKLPVEGDFMARMRNPRAAPEEWFFVDQIRNQFELRSLSDGIDTIEEGLDVLLLIHPQGLNEATLFAVDQYVLRGGKLVVFVDPHSEEQNVPQDPNNPLTGMMADRSSNLTALFDAWGLEMKGDEIVGDRGSALRVQDGNGTPVDYLVWLGLTNENGNFSSTDFVTSQLATVRFASAGVLTKKPGATTEFTPIIESTKDAQRVQKSMIQFGPDPGKLLQSFVSGDQKLTLAARIHGPVQTAFPNGKPQADAPPNGEAPAPVEALKQSKEAVNVIVVADTDVLGNRMWTRVQNFLGQTVVIPTANNCDFLLNALDNLSGSNDLISLRSRGRYQRPFERVVAIRKEADSKFRQREKELEDKLRQAEQRINDLQQGREGGDQFILSPEQEAEIKKFREEQLATRKELRKVKHDLLKDVDSLGAQLKWLNVLLVPVGLALFAAFYLTSRGRHRSKG